MLLVVVMTAAFCFSAQPAEESQETSDGFLFKVMSLFYPEVEKMTPEQKNELLEKFSSPIRKCAHFSIYAFMGVFSLLTVMSYKALKLDLRTLIAWLICIVYSVGDEIHQHFVPGRSCEIRDMLIDSSGALLGIAVTLGICLIISKIIKKRKSIAG